MKLRHRAGFRHLLRHPWQLFLAVLGVAMGVAVVVAMDLGIQSAREAFRVSSETAAGRATHQLVGGPTGVPDSLVAVMRLRAGVRTAAPVVEGYVLPGGRPDRPLRLLGIDPFSEAALRPFLAGGPLGQVDGSLLLTQGGGAFLSRETAERLGVREGEELRVRAGSAERRLQVAAILDPGDEWSRRGLQDLLVVDVSEAQDLLGREGRLDRVDLVLPEGEEGEVLADRVESVLPAGARLEAAGVRDQAMAGMIRAFDLNLRALSLLALLFGVFLIYSTMTFSVVQRRGTLGILRALGASRAQVVRGVVGEAVVLGAVGSVLGLLLGVVLGRGFVRLVTRTINDLYFVVSVEGMALPPAALLKGLGLGLGATVLASFLPAWEAASAAPREALARAAVEERARRVVPRAGAWGAALVAAGTLALIPDLGIEPTFVALFAVIVGLALLTPLATVAAVSALRPLLRRVLGVVGGMAARGVVSALSRTGPAMVALVIAVSVTVGIGVMIQSFRGSVVSWLDATLQADLYVSAPTVISARPHGNLPPGLAGTVRGLEGVAGVSASRSAEVFLGEDPVRLVAVESDPGSGSAFQLLDSRGAGAMEAFEEGAGVLVSEPFAYRRGVGMGDSVRLPGEEGEVALPVLAVYRDYGTEMGTVRLARGLYDRHWTDPHVTSLGVHLDEGADGAGVERAIRAAAGPDAALLIRSNRALRAMSLEVFDRTFALTRVLRILAFVVAFIAVLSALMALQLERGRELAVLHANGMTPGQTWGLVTTQTGLMGLVAGILALPVGLVLAVIMIFVVNRRSFGWTLEMEVGPEILVQAVLLALVGALAAGLYPSWRMSRTSPAAALRGE